MAAKDSKKEKDFKYLVIVESPAKSKTLTKILGSDYLVKSSIGHIRDLPAKGLGVDIKDNFEPTYEIMSGKTKVVSELNSFAKKADKVYLASDPDREGEAIAWHLSQILDCRKKDITRIAFNQITPDAVKAAVNNPRDINQHLVDAQQARRILDRLVGYKISPILWRKIGGRSAGRVQSIAVRLICEREEEIRAFTPEEYWSIKADANDSKDPKAQEFALSLAQINRKRISAPIGELDPEKTIVINSEAQVNDILDQIKKAQFAVSAINTRPSTRSARAPFKTSTLQRTASNAIGFTVKKTMQVAQSLYEGVTLGRGGDQTGLITYMRTDSLRIAQEAQDAAKEYILDRWGQEYYPEEPNIYDKKKKSAKKEPKEQDAHEAIRPTYVDKAPESLRQYLNDDQYRLYKLIWDRFMSSQMSPMKLEIKTLEVKSEANNPEEFLFRASYSKKTFLGYSIVFGNQTEVSEDDSTEEENSKFPETIAVGNKINILGIEPKQHFTEGPPRYSEGSLVKTLEELGIGRPSTYAPVIATVLDRKYVEKTESKSLIPTKLGMSVNELLVGHFARFINADFTSHMESQLDEVSENKIKWRDMLSDFYLGNNKAPRKKARRKKGEEPVPEPEIKEEDMGFIDYVKKASAEIENIVIETEYSCPKCDSMMHLKSSRYGPFLGCSKYPDCQTIVNLTPSGTPAPEDRPYTEENCPKCEKEKSLVLRWGRYGDYIACTTTDCAYTTAIVKRTGIACPREGCHGEIVEKKSRFNRIFYGCNSWSETKCEVVFWYPPIPLKCPECNKQMMYKHLKRGDKVACSDTKVCGFNRVATISEQDEYGKAIAESKEESAAKSVFSL